eukprot:6986998-Lingulodinium_polyedra.AAC.1
MVPSSATNFMSSSKLSAGPAPCATLGKTAIRAASLARRRPASQAPRDLVVRHERCQPPALRDQGLRRLSVHRAR